ncbi:MAG: AIPR protein, partial [Lachnospiraceae bacterium]
MDSVEFKKDFLESIKTAAAVTGEGSCAAFVDNVAQYLIDSEVLSDFSPAFYIGKNGRSKYRVDGYAYDEFDNSMNLIIANFDGNDLERKVTNTIANHDFGELRLFLSTALTSNLYREIEMSTPCADLVDFLRLNEKNIRKYRFLIFTDADMSATIKTVDIDDYNGIPIEGQIWDIDRLFRVCCSELGRQIIEIDFKECCGDGIPCLEASSAVTDQYSSYLGVIPGTVLADLYDRYGSKLLEGNV